MRNNPIHMKKENISVIKTVPTANENLKWLASATIFLAVYTHTPHIEPYVILKHGEDKESHSMNALA